MTCLALNTNPQQYKDCSQLKAALLPFKSLSKLSLKLHQGIKKLGMVLEPLKDFPLESLDLDLHISKEEMSELVELFGRLERLKVLRLVLHTSLTEGDSKYVISVLGKIKGLELLESIEIEIIPRFVLVSQVLDGVIICLADSIGPLKELKNLSFVFPMANYKKELRDLMRALQGKGKGIRQLKLDLLQQELEEEGKDELLRFMREARRLEELDLKGLVIGEKSFCEGFKEGLRRGRRLKVVRLNTVIVKVEREMYLEMIEEVCKKGGVEEYCGEYSMVEDKGKGRKKIEMKGVMERNRWLRKVMVPMSIKEEFKDFELLGEDGNKWEK